MNVGWHQHWSCLDGSLLLHSTQWGRKAGTGLVERRGFLCELRHMQHQNPPQELRFWDTGLDTALSKQKSASSAGRKRCLEREFGQTLCSHLLFFIPKIPSCQLPSPAAIALPQTQTPGLPLVDSDMLNSLWEASKGFSALSC